MVDRIHGPRLVTQELREHEATFHTFSKLVLFSALHVGLVLVCLALAFLGGLPVLALLLGLGGTVAMIAAFFVAG